MKRFLLLSLLLTVALLLGACAESPAVDTPTTTASSTTASTSATSASSSSTSTESVTSTTASTTTTEATSAATTTTTTAYVYDETPEEEQPLDYTVLKGITFYAFGDSYIEGHTLGKENTWAAMLARNYDMEYGCYGKNGSAFAVTVTFGNGKTVKPLIERYGDIPTGGDIIMVVAGRNDYNKNVPLGTATDATADTFAGAVNTVIDGLQEKHPNTLILFATQWYINEKAQAYTDMVKTICKAQGVPCFDAGDPAVSGVDMTDPAWRKEYAMSENDTDHLNENGMKLVLPKFEQFILEEYIRYLG